MSINTLKNTTNKTIQEQYGQYKPKLTTKPNDNKKPNNKSNTQKLQQIEQ